MGVKKQGRGLSGWNFNLAFPTSYITLNLNSVSATHNYSVRVGIL